MSQEQTGSVQTTQHPLPGMLQDARSMRLTKFEHRLLTIVGVMSVNGFSLAIFSFSGVTNEFCSASSACTYDFSVLQTANSHTRAQ